MTEQKTGIPQEVISAYKIGLKKESQHEVMGTQYTVPPIDKDNFYKSFFDQNFFSYGKETKVETENLNTAVWRALFFTIDNSKKFCGVSFKEFYKNDENGEQKAINSIFELSSITEILVNKNGNDIKIPESMKTIFSKENIKNDITFNDIFKGTRRGFETARLCHACEQVDPIVGGAIHVIAGILSRINQSTGEFTDVWKNSYFDSAIHELSGPKTTGYVDIIIKIVELNKDKYPNLDKFFGSSLKLDGFEGTYYDMVDIPEYQ